MTTPRGHALAVHRRAFLVLGAAGGAAGLLAACGEALPEPSSDRDADLLSKALVGEENATSALDAAAKLAKGDELATVRELARQSSANAARVERSLADLETTPQGEFTPPAGGDLDAALEAAIEQTNAAIESYRIGAGLLTTEQLRGEAIELAIADGARLAMLNRMLGRNAAPVAFVTGGAEKPYEPSEASTTTTSTTETESATTTTDPTSGGGG